MHSVLLVFGAAVSGQERRADDLAIGDRVRVVADRARFVGTVVSLSDRIMIRTDTAVIDVAPDAVTRMHRSLGWRSPGEALRRGMTYGAIVGGGTGFIVGVATAEIDMYGGEIGDGIRAGALGALAGAVLGGVVGWARPGERWESLPLERLQRLGLFAPSHGRPGWVVELAAGH